MKMIFWMIALLSFLGGCCSSYRWGAEMAREEAACTEYECRQKGDSVCTDLDAQKPWLKEQKTLREAWKNQTPRCRPYCDHWKKASPQDENATFMADALLFPFAPFGLISFPAGYLFTKWSL